MLRMESLFWQQVSQLGNGVWFLFFDVFCCLLLSSWYVVVVVVVLGVVAIGFVLLHCLGASNQVVNI